MTFDKKIFDLHYGAKYKKGVRFSFSLFAISLLLFLILLFLHFTINFGIAIFLGLIIVINFFAIPIFYCAYKRRLEQSKRQKVWFSNNKLFVELVPDNGWTWGFIEKHSKKYEVISLDSVCTNNEYILVSGEITLQDTFNGNVTSKQVNSLRIPRCFVNEEKILRLEQENYGI